MAEEELAAPDETPEVEPEHQDVPAASDGEDTTAETTEEEEVEKPKPKRGFQKRIDKLTQQVREQERYIAELQTPKEPPKGEPKRDDYEDYEKYLEDRAEWKIDQRLAQEADKRQAQTAEQRRQEAAEEFKSTRDDVVESGLSKYSDFEEIALNEDLQISQTMAEALLASDNGADLWYHLGQNPAKAEKISSLAPVRQILELGRLETSLKSSKQPSGAPTPPKPVSSRGKSDNALRDDLSIKDWMKTRRAKAR